MVISTYSEANGEPFPDRQLDPWAFSGEQSINLTAQEIPETQPSTGTSSPLSEDERPITEYHHEIVSSTSATKRKRDVESWYVARKKSKRTAKEPAIVDEISSLASQLKVVKQDLEAAKGKTRTLEKKIDVLEGRKILLDGFKAKEETSRGREGTIVTAQDRVKVLERKVERKELTIAILANVIRLSNRPCEEGE